MGRYTNWVNQLTRSLGLLFMFRETSSHNASKFQVNEKGKKNTE